LVANPNFFKERIKADMKIKTRIKAGLSTGGDCPTIGGCGLNHNQTVAFGLKVKSGVKAGESNGDLHIGH
jgi:hypothetical protein